MKVILQKNVQNLGKLGDVVEAKPGYYRNYLQPRGLALLATEGALRKRDQELEALKAKAEREHQEAVERGAKITELGSVKLTARAGEAGRLYGKVTNKDIAEAISKLVEFHIDKRGVRTLEEISALGTYRCYVKLASDVQAELNVEVSAEE